MFWIVLILISLILLYYYSTRNNDYWTRKGVKQPKSRFVFTETLKNLIYPETIVEAVAKIYNKFPNSRYSGSIELGIPTLVVKDPELIKLITIKDFDHFVDHRPIISPEIEPLWAKNLFSLRGQEWREMRATLSGSFTSSKMRQMFGLMVEASENFAKFFLNKNANVVDFEAKDTFTRFTNDVIATTAFGIKVDSLDQPNNEFYLMGKEATNFSGVWKNLKMLAYVVAPSLFKLFKFSIFSDEVRQFFTGLIDDTIKTREEQNIVRPDMINLLLEARKGIRKIEENVIDDGFAVVEEYSQTHGHIKQPKNITNTDITAQALVFFLAGFDTVATLMNFMAYELAVNPDIQTRLREEILETYKECNGKVTYEAILKMKYLDMVVSETLRKWPAAIAIDRYCIQPYTIQPVLHDETPVKIEVGESIFISVYGIHMDPKNYPNPTKFDPDRFSDENKANIKPYTYLPFGSGPRNCIGSRFALLETKTVFYHILLNFELVPTGKSNIPYKFSKKSLNLEADGGCWLGMKRLEPVH